MFQSNPIYSFSSSSRVRVMNHNWSAKKQRLHPQSVAEISCHSVLSGDRIRQRETSSGSRHKDTDQCLFVAISFCRHRNVHIPCENGSGETTVAERGRNPVSKHQQASTKQNLGKYSIIIQWCDENA